MPESRVSVDDVEDASLSFVEITHGEAYVGLFCVDLGERDVLWDFHLDVWTEGVPSEARESIDNLILVIVLLVIRFSVLKDE